MSEQVLIYKKSTKIPPKKKLIIEIQETGKERSEQKYHMKITLNGVITEVDALGQEAHLIFIDYFNRYVKSLVW